MRLGGKVFFRCQRKMRVSRRSGGPGRLAGLIPAYGSYCMTELRRDELVKYSRGRMHILDRSALAEPAELADAFLNPEIKSLGVIDISND